MSMLKNVAILVWREKNLPPKEAINGTWGRIVMIGTGL